MIPYIPHVALLLSICLVFYKVFLEKETFFKLNRYLLISCIALSFVIPTLVIPQDWSIWNPESSLIAQEQVSPLSTDVADDPIIINESTSPAPQASEAPAPKEELAEASPANKIAFVKSINWIQVLWIVYLVGIAIFGINLLIQLFTLLVQMIRLPSLKDGRFRIIEMNQDKAPYSFMNCIFINPTKYDWDTYTQILEHEKIHVQQLHSVDMILAELLVVLQWFNPLAWQYRKAIENNLEYLTDNAMLHQGAAREPYQLNLLKVSVPQYPIGLAMNYNQSILKKRIKMMNAKKSSVRTSWKYLAIVPLLGLTILCFNAVQVAAKQEKPSNYEQVLEQFNQETVNELANVSEEISTITSTVINEEIQGAVEMATDIAQIVTEQLEAPLSQNQQTFAGEAPLEMKGVWQAEIDGSEVCMRFDNSNFKRNSYWISTECFQKNEFSSLPTTEGEFTLKRAAGTVTFKGKFDDEYGMGRYTFAPDNSFAKYLNDQGIKGEAKEETMFHFFLSNIDQAYVSDLKKEGYRGLDMKQLKKLAIHDVSREYIRAMAQAGYDDLELEDLVKAKIHDIDPAYIKELSQAGFSNLDFDDLVRFAIHDVDADMVKELNDAGFKDLRADEIVKAAIHNVDVEYIQDLASVGYEMDDLDDLVRFSIHNVDAEFVKALKEAGYGDLSADKITKAAIHNVSPRYIEELADVGYEMDDIDDIVRFAIHNVDADLVKALKDVGYDDLSPKEITNAAIHNVSPRYIKDLKAAGIDMPEIDDVIKFKIHNVDVDFIEALEDAGYKNLDPEEIRRAAIHNVSGSYIRDLKASGIDLPEMDDVIRFATHNVSISYINDLKKLGYDDLDAGDIIKAKIHNVRPDFISGLNDLGFKNIPMDDIINLKIHNVSPRFIKSAQEKGYKDLSLEEYKKIKIHGIYRQD